MLLLGVGCEFLFKPLLAADTNPGIAFPNGNHPDERPYGARYRLVRWAEFRRVRAEHDPDCNTLCTAAISSQDHVQSRRVPDLAPIFHQ